jgi:AraC-like DNA-binding protein
VSRDLTTFCRAWLVITGRANGLHATAQLDGGDIAHLRSALPGFQIDAGPRTILTFDRAALDSAPSQSDPDTSRDLQPVITHMMQQRTAHQRFSSVVRSMIDASTEAPPTMERVAHDLHVDTRTLRRRLAAEGTSYRSLLGDARASMAAYLLADPSLTIDKVASRLGYHDAAALSKAFHRWYGQSPGTFRSDKRVMSIGD